MSKHLKNQLDDEIKKELDNIDDSTVHEEKNVQSIEAEANSENKDATKAKFRTSVVSEKGISVNKVPLDLSVSRKKSGTHLPPVAISENEVPLDLSVSRKENKTYLIPNCSENEELVVNVFILSNDQNEKNIVIDPEGGIGTGIFNSKNVYVNFTPNIFVRHSIINLDAPSIEVSIYYIKNCKRIFKRSFSFKYEVSPKKPPKKPSPLSLSLNLKNILDTASFVNLANYDNSISSQHDPLLVEMLKKGAEEKQKSVFYKTLIKKIPELHLKDFFEKIVCFLRKLPFSEDSASGCTSEYKASEFTTEDLFNIFTSTEDVDLGQITKDNASGIILPKVVALECASGKVESAQETSDGIDEERAKNRQTPSKRSSQMLSPSGPRRKSPRKVQSDGDSISESLSRVGFADEKL